ncbi:MAG TPA: hypothetical protein VF518_05895, partial [Polyangia bacterium]
IATALMGNPTHAVVQGGLRVFLKFALPILVLSVIVGQALSFREVMATMRIALFLIMARTIHLTVAIFATSNQFYTPYRLAEELTYYLLFSLTFAITYLLVIAVRRRAEAQS